MRNLILGIHLQDENGNIFSSRRVGKNWTVDEQDMNGFIKKHFFEEVSEILVENLKVSVKAETIMDMFDEAMKGKQ